MTLLKYELLILVLVFAQFLMTQPFDALSTIAKLCSSSQDSLMTRLSGGDGLGAAGTTLAAGKVLGDKGLRGLLHNLGALGEDHLDVAGVGHVRVDLKGC